MVARCYSQSAYSLLDRGVPSCLMILLLSSFSFVVLGCQSTRLTPNESNYKYSQTVNHTDSKAYSDTSKGNSENEAFKNANEIALIRTQIASEYLAQNKIDEARRQLDKALLANEQYAPAYDLLGALLHHEGSPVNIAKAETYFVKALELDPNLMSARNNYGVYLAEQGRYQEAIIQFEVASTRLGYEGRIGALENLGRTLLKVGNNKLASQAFVRVLESDRQNIAAHIELVDLLIMNNRISQAQNLYNELLALIGEDAKLTPRIVSQGVKLAQAQNNESQ